MRELPEQVFLKEKLSNKKLVSICDEPIKKLQGIQMRVGDTLTILDAEHKIHDIGIYTYPTNYIFDTHGKKKYER